MFLLHRPSAREVEQFIAASRELPLSYDPVGLAAADGAAADGSAADGAAAGGPGFTVDEQSAVVGSGEAAFARAKAALVAWRHFELGWVELFPRRPPIAPGTVVAVSVHHLGFWSLNGCRVVYSTGAETERTFGFAYGTLANHAERGEEIFQVSFNPDTGDVCYLIRAVSRPRAPLARLGYPLTRSLQARFRRDSARAVRRAVERQEDGGASGE